MESAATPPAQILCGLQSLALPCALYLTHSLIGRRFLSGFQDLPVLLAQELIPQVPNEVLIDDNEGGSSPTSSSPSSNSEYSPS